MGFLAGQYTGTYTAPAGSALSIGQTAAGLTIEHQVFAKPVTGDTFADTPQDGIFRGMAMFASYTLIEHNAAGAAGLLWPYGSSYLTQGVVGRLLSAMAGSLVMTAVAGTPAASAPASQTHPKAILAEGFPVGILYAPDLRVVPMRQRLFCNNSGVFGTQT